MTATMDIGPAELLVVLVVALLFLGPKKLPQLARSIGEAVREFRHGSEGSTDAEERTPSTGPDGSFS